MKIYKITEAGEYLEERMGIFDKESADKARSLGLTVISLKFWRII